MRRLPRASALVLGLSAGWSLFTMPLGAALFATGCGEDVPARIDGGRERDGAVGADASSDLDGGGGVVDGGASTDGGTGTDDGGSAPVGPTLDEIVALLEDPSSTAEELDAALHEVGRLRAHPFVEGDRALFATRWDDAPPSVALVGDINGWDMGRHPAAVAASGVHYWVVARVAELTPPLEGAKYKWWGAPDVYRAPPEATAYGFDTNGEHGYVERDPSIATRERFNDFSSRFLGPSRAMRVLLPAGYAMSATPSNVRVLVLHDGQNVFHPDAVWGGWRIDVALAAAEWSDVFVVAVDNASDRFDAYTHVPDRIDSGPPVGGHADDYLRMLDEEVMPFVRARYGVLARGSRTAVMGSSLGGLVSLYLALRAPSFASCVIAMSPTTGWGAYDPALDGSDALVRRWSAEVGHGPVAVYLDSGGGVTGACADSDGDGVFEDADDTDGYCTTNQLRDLLETEGYAFGTDLFHWYEASAPHNEAAWAARVPNALASCRDAGWTR